MPRKLISLLLILLLLPACAFAAPEWDETKPLGNGLLAVRRGEEWGLADGYGNVLLQPCLSEAPEFRGETGIAAKGTGVKDPLSSYSDEIPVYGLIDAKGETILPFEYGNLYFCRGTEETVIRARAKDKDNLLSGETKVGLLNGKGEVILPLEYSYIGYDFIQGRMVVERKTEDGVYLKGMIDESGAFILPCEYRSIHIGEDSVAAQRYIQSGDFAIPGTYSFLTPDGETVLETDFAFARPFKGDYAVVGMYLPSLDHEDDGAQELYKGAINRDGEIVVPCLFDSLYIEGDGLFNARRRGYWPWLRASGGKASFISINAEGSEEILPDWAADWANVIPLKTEPKTYLAAYLYGREDGYALVDAQGQPLYGGTLDKVEPFSCGVALVRDGGQYGYLKETGEWIAEPQFEEAESFQCGVGLVRVAEHCCGFLDTRGRWVVEPSLSFAMDFKNGYAEVSPTAVDGRGVIDTAGNYILPPEYDYIGDIADDGTVRAEKNGNEHIFLLTPEGAREITSVGSNLSLEDYHPFTGSKVATLENEPNLAKRASAEHPHPRLDGATALYPVYAAVVQAVYPEDTRYGEEESNPLITCTKTNRAYERLIYGQTDVIFCAGPSDAQLEMARQAGVEFELTPFGKEAFVFIVHPDNPLENISVDQIRDIYSGKTTQWSELGVDGLGGIIAYQRPENSGSQTALQRLMGDVTLMQPPQEYVVTFMDEVLETVEYRNHADAIGYSFRFFCTDMAGSGVKMLSIDGVAPTLENIRSDSYPITSTLYMVTRKGEENPNVQALVDWVLSPEGAELIEKSGYVALN